jgi:Phospholipid methyltransferase
MSIGCVLIVIGCALHWLSKAYLEQNRDLTTAGPYRFTRNPFYLANLVIDAGIVCVIGQVWVALLYFPVWGLAYAATIRGEEARLRELFDERFEDYAAAVPRFFPTRRPLPAESACGRFDLRNPSLAAGREYARLLGILIAPATLWAAAVLRRLRFEILDEVHDLELGLILFVPVLWIVKLALAEMLTRPQTRLIPFPVASPARVVTSVAVLIPLTIALLRGGSSALVSSAVALLAATASTSFFRLDGGSRLWVAVLLGVWALALSAMGNVFGLAFLPALWFLLSILDEVARMRTRNARNARNGRSASGSEPSARPDWRYFPRVALGATLALAALGAAQVWVR